MVNPLLLLSVNLVTLPVKVEAGILCAEEPLKSTIADALLASILPDERLILPLRVRVLAPTVKVPLVRLIAPAMVKD